MKTTHVLTNAGRRQLSLCAAWLTLVTTISATPVTTNLVFWVDAADPANTGITPTLDNTALATWVNKAPALQQRNVPSVVQATAGLQPLIRTGVNGLNGLPVVRFDGVDDFMQSANAFNDDLNQPTQIFIVWKADSTGAGAGMGTVPAAIAYDGFSGSGRHTIAYELQQANGIDMFAGSATSVVLTPFSTAIYATAVYNGTASLRINGVDQTFSGTNSVGSQAMDGVTLGGRFATFDPGSGPDRLSLDGYIAEMLIYSSPLSTGPNGGDRGAVEAYLNNKWFVVPEPGSLSLLACGALLALRRRRVLVDR